MPKLRVRFWRAAATALLAIPLSLAACTGSEGGGPAGGADAALSAVAFSAGALNPAFEPGTTAYFLSVPYGAAPLTVTPTASDQAARIQVTQDAGAAAPVASGAASAALAVPAPGARSVVMVTVTAGDGATTRRYGFLVTQQARQASDDASLAMLADSAGVLTAFASGTTTYAYRVPYQAAGYRVTPTATNPRATIRVNGTVVASGAASPDLRLVEGANAVTIAVTAEDGTATRTYTLDVTEGTRPGLVNARAVPVAASPLLAVPAGATLPASGAGAVPVDTRLRLGFDAAPTFGPAGAIRIFRAADDVEVDAIRLEDPYAIYDGTGSGATSKKLAANLGTTKLNVIGGTTVNQVRIVNYVPIRLSGQTAVIHPHDGKLAWNTQYYVTIDDGVLNGTIGGAAFHGVTARAWTFTTKASAAGLTVAADNSADYATVQGAIDAIPRNNTAAVTIDIAPGVYEELLWIRGKNNVTLRGTDSVATVIQYDNCDGFNPGTGGGQAGTVTDYPIGAFPAAGGTTTPVAGGGRAVLLMSAASGVVLDTITLKNTHPQGSLVVPTLPAPSTLVSGTASPTPGPTFVNYRSAVTQAETLYFNTSWSATAEAGQLVAKHSNFVSYQDTLQVKGWSWFYDCFITGDVDFIWGNANTALFERSEIRSRFNANGAAIVQSRAILGAGTATPAPTAATTAFAGFVFLNCALTKESGDFTAYLARSPGVASAGAGVYSGYDQVSFIDCSMDVHIAAAGWNVVGGNPGGANVAATPVTGWKEAGSFTPAGQYVNVSSRLAEPSPSGSNAAPGGSIQLPDAAVAALFPNRSAIFNGGSFTTTAAGRSVTYTLSGISPAAGWNPAP